ncbi:hypothetical protein [Chitinophaga ginsengisegetis]|uniref:hypothetical protein n=1 Tax=Chitinophaga ginsengisegetis TaxID=393003 RepID=UPI000DB900AF|nr:hypothetical protein [Chitinophaga ginsengisegetis]MDR6568734.1 hypothetical protein [Chitinophaga ginsengisegetis]MDR6648035.1 hypothetical protein [Chitinophaga ginsengisegetis]MDR6654815.1 hypothetical protein [Chitinophaga ginsengisegetis]
MNTNTPYEQLIATKLNQVPVPDMADSIWTSIEMQLDAVTEVPDKKTTPKFKGKGWYGFAGLTVAVTALWWYSSYTNHTQKIVTPQKDSSVTEMPSPAKNIPIWIDSPEKKIIPVMPAPVKTDSISLEETPGNHTNMDSVAERIFPLIKLDSSSHNNANPLVDSISIPPPIKKARGVKGISSDDYKISAEKDAGRKY